jgi:hypothetical protein
MPPRSQLARRWRMARLPWGPETAPAGGTENGRFRGDQSGLEAGQHDRGLLGKLKRAVSHSSCQTRIGTVAHTIDMLVEEVGDLVE